MATCGSLKHIFENPLPENPTLLESLSWSQKKTLQSMENSSSFTEIFGELHFKESPLSTGNSVSSTPITNNTTTNNNESLIPLGDVDYMDHMMSLCSVAKIANNTNKHKSRDRFSSLSCESLQLCTEGLGFESSDEVEELKSGVSEDCWGNLSEKEGVENKKLVSSEYCKRSRVNMGEYPPPISSIGRTGKPWVCFRSYRSDGRFVLKEIRIPTKEFLHACREDGRLKLHFVQPEDEILEEDYDDDVECIDEEEESMGEENDVCVIDHVNEGIDVSPID